MIFIAEYNVIVRDKDNNILTQKQLEDKVIDCEPYYINMALITKRIKNQYNFDKVQWMKKDVVIIINMWYDSDCKQQSLFLL